MITKICIQNFKAFEKLELSLRPITILVGPNNSGKSAIMSSLRILAQTIQGRDIDIPLLLNGAFGDFGTYKDIVHTHHRRRRVLIKIDLQTKRGPVSLKLVYRYRTQRREINLYEVTVEYGKTNKLIGKYSDDNERLQYEIIINGKKADVIDKIINSEMRTTNFLPMLGSSTRFIRLLDKQDHKLAYFEKIFELSMVLRDIFATLSGIDFIGAMRKQPDRLMTYTGLKYLKIGRQGENYNNILAMDSSLRGKKSKKLIDKVSTWLRNSSIASEIDIKPVGEINFELLIKHLETLEKTNIADVGYGLCQVLPVIVGGYNLERTNTYLVEEPEIHLHPRAQGGLAEFLYDLHKESVYTIVETHSEHLIIRMQSLVAKGLINKKDVVVYYISSDNEKKDIRKIEIDDLGRFTNEWPQGFFPDRTKEVMNLAKIRSSRRNENE